MEDNALFTTLLADWRSGDDSAEGRLVEMVYPHLKAIAANRLRHGNPGHSIDTTDLVQEVFVKLIGQRKSDWRNRAHFFAIAARLMRRIVVDRARQRESLKRGADVVKVSLASLPDLPAQTNPDWLELHRSLTELGEIDPLAERVTELRFFAGLTETETAEVLDSSRRTVARKWRFARAWLEQKLQGDDPEP